MYKTTKLGEGWKSTTPRPPSNLTVITLAMLLETELLLHFSLTKQCPAGKLVSLAGVAWLGEGPGSWKSSRSESLANLDFLDILYLEK